MAAQPVELGQTGIVVAPLGVGVMSWGTKRTLAYGGADSEQAEQEALRALLDAGVTLVDTAEMYRNEERIGALVHGHKGVVLATKYSPFPWRRKGSVLAALDRSLARLQVDHVHLYQVHMQPRAMSMRTLMQQLAIAQRDGRVLPSFRGKNFEALPPVIRLLTEIGKGHDSSASQVALRWLIQRGAVPIPGAKNAAQARSNAGALDISLHSGEMDALDAATRAWRR